MDVCFFTLLLVGTFSLKCFDRINEVSAFLVGLLKNLLLAF